MGDPHAGPSSYPLPPGWNSHTSPSGRTYYHHASTGRSTYTFPHPPKPKREKPIAKTPIPGIEGWFKVTTNKGNEFYFHPKSKQSEWLPPKEVADALRVAEEKQKAEEARLKREAEERERRRRERRRREKRERKRKLEEGVPITEFDAAAKRVRADEEDEDDEEEDEDLESTAEEEAFADERPSHTSIQVDSVQTARADQAQLNQQGDDQDEDENDDEEWQRQIAAQMAAEAEAEADTQAQVSSSPPPAQPSPQPLPSTSSLEEQEAAFMNFLTSLNSTPNEINPMAPWDLEQPKFSHHPTYLVFTSAHDAEDAFNEWCKLRIREKRAAKPSGEAAYRQLLKEEVRSTRTKYSDFASAFRQDARFKGFTKGEGEREKLFKAHLVELGEEKRRAAERAEKEFLVLLSDKLPGNHRDKVSAAKASAAGKEAEKEGVMNVWLTAKRTAGVVDDPRYDAVGSSTRRFELFCVWAKGERRQHAPPPPSLPGRKEGEDDAKAHKARAKEEERRKALREREDKVRRERERITRLNRSALSSATREESRLAYRQLLLDAVTSPHISFHSAISSLAKDPRFNSPGLSDHDREELFQEHQSRLLEREGSKITAIFAKYAKSLDAEREDVIALALHDELLSQGALKVYKENPRLLENAYDNWHSERTEKARREFFEMLKESAFVEFWGRLKKQAAQSSNHKEEGEEEGEEVMLVDMAKKVDLREIEAVLRNDARFRVFKHVPEQREEWIREHLHQLAAPSKSVHK